MIKNFLSFCLLALAANSCSGGVESGVTIVEDGLTFNEGSVPYGSTLLVSNFGGEQLNPLNGDGLGYIAQLDGDQISVFIPASGVLNAPKGMAIEDDYLYIADVGQVVVYNLNNLEMTPTVIPFPEGELFVNDIAIDDDVAYITVTNTGNIYALDISSPADLTVRDLSKYLALPGANGVVFDDDVMYVASYAPDGNTTDVNVIYKIEEINNPQPTRLIERMGQYDGLVVEDDKLYFTNWVGGEVGYVDLETEEITFLDLGDLVLAGPAALSIMDDTIYIPDLPNSRLVVVNL